MSKFAEDRIIDSDTYDTMQSDLRTLAEAVLESHRCMLPGWSQERCLKDQGETCSHHYMGQDANKCKYYNKCDCPACLIARRYTESEGE